MDEVPQPIYDDYPLEEYQEEVSAPFIKKFFLFMAVEAVFVSVAIFAFVHFAFVKSATVHSHIAPAPVEAYNAIPDQNNKDKTAVLGAEAPTPSPTPHIIVIIPPTATPTPLPSKKSYKIALIGDSMEDTMGETGEYLQKSLKEKYPDNDFLIYNYGVGATTVKDGLERFDKDFKYGIRNYAAIPDLKPDVIIIGSFANNPPNPYDRDWQWITLTQLVQKAQKVTPNVYLLAEVAPLRDTYGKGPNGVNWDPQYARMYSGHVIELLENVIGLGNTLHVPVVDAYTPSLVPNSPYGKEGQSKYISLNDGIHPSFEGHEFMADLMAKALKFQ